MTKASSEPAKVRSSQTELVLVYMQRFQKIQSPRLTWKEQDTASGVLVEVCRGGFRWRERCGGGHRGIMGTKTQAEVKRAPAARVLRRRPWQQPLQVRRIQRRLWVTVQAHAPQEGLTLTLPAFPPVSGCRKRRASIWPRGMNTTALKTHNREVCYLRLAKALMTVLAGDSDGERVTYGLLTTSGEPRASQKIHLRTETLRVGRF